MTINSEQEAFEHRMSKRKKPNLEDHSQDKKHRCAVRRRIEELRDIIFINHLDDIGEF